MKIRCAQKGADPELPPKYQLLNEGVQKLTPSYYLKNVAPKYQGEYIHPKLTIS